MITKTLKEQQNINNINIHTYITIGWLGGSGAVDRLGHGSLGDPLKTRLARLDRMRLLLRLTVITILLQSLLCVGMIAIHQRLTLEREVRVEAAILTLLGELRLLERCASLGRHVEERLERLHSAAARRGRLRKLKKDIE